VTLGLLVMLALAPVRQYLDQRSRIAELERRTVELEQQNADLRATINGLSDPAELERLARECLGMVGPGETALIIPGEQPARADC
jgi:cell division protein FtsB